MCLYLQCDDDVIVNNNSDCENEIENVWAVSINRADKFQSHPDRWIFVRLEKSAMLLKNTYLLRWILTV